MIILRVRTLLLLQVKDTTTSSTLEINKAKSEYTGTYTARIENVAGRADSTANLLVAERTDTVATPVFSQNLSDIKVNQGHPAKFLVKIGGKPLSVMWFKVRVLVWSCWCTCCYL